MTAGRAYALLQGWAEKIKPGRGIGAVLLLTFAGTSAADTWQWAEGAANGEGGATREFYNSAAALRWRHKQGDWRDRSGQAQGELPFAELTMPAGKADLALQWDVTELVRHWLSGQLDNRGVLLRTRSKSGLTVSFASREHSDNRWQPRLRLQLRSGEQVFSATADTHLDPSTYKAKGKTNALKISQGNHHALLRFDLPSAIAAADLQRATLELYALNRTGGAGSVQVYAVDLPTPALPPIAGGLAREFPADRGIAKHPQVVYASQFEDDDWQDAWQGLRGHYQRTAAQTSARGEQFVPLQGSALRIRIETGQHYGASGSLKFAPLLGNEPEQMYVRYYLRFADNWRPRVQGGKLPGFAGTYGRAGWGGRANTGADGWSARGAFALQIPDGNPLAGRTPIGSYVYEVGKSADFGAQWIWSEGRGAFLERNQWYCIEQYLQLNTPGKDDGVLQAWLNGQEVLNRRDLRLRLVPDLKIEQFWLDIYHGGTAKSPYNQDLYIDNLVIARSYIGPMAMPETRANSMPAGLRQSHPRQRSAGQTDSSQTDSPQIKSAQIESAQTASRRTGATRH